MSRYYGESEGDYPDHWWQIDLARAPARSGDDAARPRYLFRRTASLYHEELACLGLARDERLRQVLH